MPIRFSLAIVLLLVRRRVGPYGAGVSRSCRASDTGGQPHRASSFGCDTHDVRGAPRYGILGALYVGDDRGSVLIRSPLQRLLFAVLLVEVNRTVTADRLADELWGDRPPEDARGALRTQVSRLRKSLPEGTPLVTDASG